MKILITGASGFIGRNFLLGCPKSWKVFATYNESVDFLKFIIKNNLKHVEPIRCDLTNDKDVASLFVAVGGKVDVCLYLAANGDPARSSREPAHDLLANQLGLVRLLEKISVKRFIYFSSGAVYDGLKGRVDVTSQLDPKLPYAISKLAAEGYVKHFQKHGQIKEYVILRFFGAFGPYEPARKVYTKLVCAFALERLNEFTVTGNGKNFIDAMYVDDTIDAILKVIKSPKKNLTVDFCCGKPLSINDLVKKCAKTFGVQHLKIIHQGVVPEYIQFKVSPSKMKNVFGFAPKISLEQGLKQLAAFLKEFEHGKK